MKKIILLAATLSMAMQATTIYAAENQQSNKQSMNSSMQGSGMMDKGNMEMMKQNMQKMKMQMKEIHSTRDPRIREQLMHEHMQNMHKGMQMMRSMGGDMMMGMMSGKKGSAGMMDKGMTNNMSSKECGQRHQMMGDRMDMMQMMMEQMMGRMSMREGMMPKMGITN